MRKWLFRILLVIALIPILVVSTWYSISFLPHLSELNKIQKQGESVVSHAPATFYSISVASESEEGIRGYAFKQAYWFLGCEQRPIRMLWWHINCMLWYYASYLHFSDKQVFAIWAYYIPYEKGRGLGDAAMYYFKKPLSELDERSYAALIAAAEAPSVNKPGSERSERRINEILKRSRKP